jgi:hypothetical protein
MVVVYGVKGSLSSIKISKMLVANYISEWDLCNHLALVLAIVFNSLLGI